MSRHVRQVGFIACACLAATGWPARGGKHAKKFAGLTVTGDKVKTSKDGKTQTATGNACAKWQKLKILANRIVLERVSNEEAALPKRAEATGDVRFTQNGMTFKCSELHFDPGKATIAMATVTGKGKVGKRWGEFAADIAAVYILKQRLVASGDVIFVVRNGTIRATRVEVDLKTKRYKLVNPAFELKLR